MKQILWKSELWYLTVTFGIMALFCLALVSLHVVDGEWGAAFGIGLIGLIPAGCCGYFAFTPYERLQTAWGPRLEQAVTEAQADSCLNPENMAPEKRNPPVGLIA